MADDTTVVESPGFEPEPIPDNIADTELFGIEPAEEATADTAEDTEQDATEQDQAEPQPDESGTPTEETTEPELPAQQPQEAQQEANQQVRELTGAERRLAEKQQQDFVTEQRQQIREYEQQVNPEDVSARMQVLEAKQYIDTVERNRMSVVADASRVVSDIPFFKSGTPQAQAAFAQVVETFNNAYGVTDPDTGEFIGAVDRNGNNVSLFNYAQQQAAIYEQIAATNQRQGQQAEAKMRAKAVNPSNPGKVTSQGDELEDLLDKVGDVDLTRM